MALSLLPTFSQLRRTKYAMTHNWTFTILPGMLSNPLFAPVTGFLMQLIEGYAGGYEVGGTKLGSAGGVNMNCTSSTIPRSRLKVIKEMIHGMPVQQVCGREDTSGTIELKFLDLYDLRIFKLFEILKQLGADRFSGKPTTYEIPYIKMKVEAKIDDGVLLTLYDGNRWRPTTQYRLLDAYVIDAAHTPLGSDEQMIETTVTIQYLNYDIVDVGIFGALDLIPGLNLLGESKSMLSL
jgi:hypothetical protein